MLTFVVTDRQVQRQDHPHEGAQICSTDDERESFTQSSFQVVAESYLNNIVREVEMLIERHKQYQERLHTLDPTLRSRVQHRAVDDVFDNEMLPGERWVRP